MDIKQRITLACRELAKTKGFHSLTVDELASASGISKRTLYRYFRSKEEIIEWTLDSFMEETKEFVDTLLEKTSDPEDFLRAFLKHLFLNGQFIFNPPGLEDLRIHYPHLWRKLDSFRIQRMKQIVGTLLANPENHRLHEINPIIIATVIQASIQATLNPDFLLNNHLNFEETASQVSRFWIAALR